MCAPPLLPDLPRCRSRSDDTSARNSLVAELRPHPIPIGEAGDEREPDRDDPGARRDPGLGIEYCTVLRHVDHNARSNERTQDSERIPQRTPACQLLYLPDHHSFPKVTRVSATELAGVMHSRDPLDAFISFLPIGEDRCSAQRRRSGNRWAQPSPHYMPRVTLVNSVYRGELGDLEHRQRSSRGEPAEERVVRGRVLVELDRYRQVPRRGQRSTTKGPPQHVCRQGEAVKRTSEGLRGSAARAISPPRSGHGGRDSGAHERSSSQQHECDR